MKRTGQLRHREDETVLYREKRKETRHTTKRKDSEPEKIRQPELGSKGVKAHCRVEKRRGPGKSLRTARKPKRQSARRESAKYTECTTKPRQKGEKKTQEESDITLRDKVFAPASRRGGHETIKKTSRNSNATEGGTYPNSAQKTEEEMQGDEQWNQLIVSTDRYGETQANNDWSRQGCQWEKRDRELRPQAPQKHGAQGAGA